MQRWELVRHMGANLGLGSGPSPAGTCLVTLTQHLTSLQRGLDSLLSGALLVLRLGVCITGSRDCFHFFPN